MAKKKKKFKDTKFGKGIGKIGKGVKKIAKDIDKFPFAPLLPFKVAMKTILKEKGHTPKEGFTELAQQFYNVVVQRKSNYEIEAYENLSPSIIAAIISGVLAYFKDLKKRKDEGDQLSKGERDALDVAEKTTESVVSDFKREAVQEAKSKGFDTIVIAGIIALVVLFVFGVGGKRKK